MKLKYLGIETYGYEEVEAIVRKQTAKATRIVPYLKQMKWRNKHMDVIPR